MKADATISISYNAETVRVPAHSSLSDVLEIVGVPDQPFAVAVNTAFIARDEYGNTEIGEGDRIDLVVAIEGG